MESRMSHFVARRNGFAACEEVRCAAPPSTYGRRNPVLCPRPRRLGQLAGADAVKPLRFNPSNQMELSDSTAGAEILNILLTEDNYDNLDQQPACAVASPPHFCGSPPSRASNPLVHDPRFLEEKYNNPLTQQFPFIDKPNTPLTSVPFPFPFPPSSSSVSGIPPFSPSASTRRGCVCSSTHFGPTAAAVRIEGFDCLNRDQHGCRISAFA